jgi:transcriptional antiterminator RfaH
MTAEFHPRWFVAHTQPHAEVKATAHLARQGFQIYFPRYLKRRRHARKIETVAAPLFPRYLFVSVDKSVQRWRSIYSTVGVALFYGRNVTGNHHGYLGKK